MHSVRKLDTGRTSAQNEEKAMIKEKKMEKGRQWLLMLRKTEEDWKVLP